MKTLAALLLLSALPAAAQWRHFGDDAQLSGYFGAGVSAPVNPIATRLDTGWNLAGGVGVKYRYVGLMVSGLYNDFGLNRRALAIADARRGSQRYWGVTLDPVVHVNPHGPVDFYLTGGAGVYGQVNRFRSSFDGRYDLIDSYQVVRPGANIGAGFAFNIGRERDPKIFVEARYHHMFTRGVESSFVPVTIGIRF